MSTGNGTPSMQTHPPKPSPSIHRSLPPMDRAMALTRDFEGNVELSPEHLQSGHHLQEKGSRLLWARGWEDRGLPRGHHFESNSLETPVVPHVHWEGALASTD